MTFRFFALSVLGAFSLLVAFSTTEKIFFLLFWLDILMLAEAVLSVLRARAALSVKITAARQTVRRNDTLACTVTAACRKLFPLAPLHIFLREDVLLCELEMRMRGGETVIELECPHVGQYCFDGVYAVARDIFGLLSVRCPVRYVPEPVTVLPLVHSTPKLRFSPGDSEDDRATRAFEDATLPTDIRAYRDGDELKKVHWKLSMRRRTLMVRTYEQPMRSDVLLLVDCAHPESLEIRDRICEDAASLISRALETQAHVYMPLAGSAPCEVNGSAKEDIPVMLAALANAPFDGVEQFERVLLLETRRMRRTGATAVFTARMNPTVADMILRIGRLGPKVRLYLAVPGDPALISRLRRNDIEVFSPQEEMTENMNQTEQNS